MTKHVEQEADRQNALPTTPTTPTRLTAPTSTAIGRRVSTLCRMLISGSDTAITNIMKASVVPRAAPLSSNASTIGMTPAAMVYMGMPMSTAAGTDHHASSPMIRTIRSAETLKTPQSSSQPSSRSTTPGGFTHRPAS